MEDTVKYFIDNLSVLESLKEGDKLTVNSTTNSFTIDEPVMFQGVWRYFSNSSRGDTVKAIHKLLTNIETFVNAVIFREKESKNRLGHSGKYGLSDKTCVMFSLLANSMENSVRGLENLKVTYKDDETIVKQLNKILSRIESIAEFIKNNI